MISRNVDECDNTTKGSLKAAVTGQIAIVEGKISAEIYPEPGKLDYEVRLGCGSWSVAKVCGEISGTVEGTITISR